MVVTDKEETCMQSFYNLDYKAVKTRVPDQVEGTCEWIGRNSRFKYFLQAHGNNLLWVSGPPGCGKTVMISWLIDMMPKLRPGSTTLFFFCDDKIAAQREVETLLQSVIHQILEGNPHLIKYALRHYKTKGQRMLTELNVLWDILRSCFDDPSVSEITCLFDGLDELEESGRKMLLRLMKDYVQATDRGKVKFLFTARPDVLIADTMMGLQNARLRLEAESVAKCINDDIKLVVDNHVKNLPPLQRWEQTRKDSLIERLVRNADRTFLWISIVLKMISDIEDASPEVIEQYLIDLPDALEEVYSHILGKVRIDLREKGKKLLELLVAAQRPLSLEEINIAWALGPDLDRLADLDTKLQSDVTRTIRLLCGQFVRIIDGHCYLVHQTAKEFLLSFKGKQRPSAIEPWYSIKLDRANASMAEKSICYLSLDEIVFDSSLKPFLGLADETTYLSADFPPFPWLRHRLKGYCGKFKFLDYALQWWMYHIRQTKELRASYELDLMDSMIRVYGSEIFQLHWWLSIDWTARLTSSRKDLSTDFPFDILGLCAYNGHSAIILHLLIEDTDINSHISPLGLTALHMAVLGQQADTVFWLLEHGADTEMTDLGGETPILTASYQDNYRVLEALVEWGANVEAKDLSGSTPLMKSTERSSTSQMKVLLELGADADAVNRLFETAIHAAASVDSLAKVKLLLDYGANVHVLDQYYRTPLHVAVENGAKDITNLLLKRGVSTRYRDLTDSTALGIAVGRHDIEMARLLLQNGADPNDWVHGGTSLLDVAAMQDSAESEDNQMSLLLREFGADSSASYNNGPTLLSLAVAARQADQVSYLLEMRQNPNIKDQGNALTPLDIAVRTGQESIVADLIEYNARVRSHFERGPSPLSISIRKQDNAITQLLLQHGADPLSPACCPKHLPLTQALRIRDRDCLEMIMLALDNADPPLRSNTYSKLRTLIDDTLGNIETPCLDTSAQMRITEYHNESTSASCSRERPKSMSILSSCESFNSPLTNAKPSDNANPESMPIWPRNAEQYWSMQEHGMAYGKERLSVGHGIVFHDSIKHNSEESKPEMPSRAPSPQPYIPLKENMLSLHEQYLQPAQSLFKRWLKNDEWSNFGSNKPSGSSCRAVDPTISHLSEDVIEVTESKMSKAMSVASEAHSRSNSRASSVASVHVYEEVDPPKRPAYHDRHHSRADSANEARSKYNRPKRASYSSPRGNDRYSYNTRGPGSVGSGVSSGGSDTSFRGRYDIYKPTRPGSYAQQPGHNHYNTRRPGSGISSGGSDRSFRGHYDAYKPKEPDYHTYQYAQPSHPKGKQVKKPHSYYAEYAPQFAEPAYDPNSYTPTDYRTSLNNRRGSHEQERRRSLTHAASDGDVGTSRRPRRTSAAIYPYSSSPKNTYYTPIPASRNKPSPEKARPSAIRNQKRPAAKPPKPPRATPADAERHNIPAGYSLKNWDPAEEPILVLGSVFDANSLGKWIYDWTIHHWGAGTPIPEVAGELWLVLIRFASQRKRAEEYLTSFSAFHGRKDDDPDEEEKELVEDFAASEERLWKRFKTLIDRCVKAMEEDGKREGKNKKKGVMSGVAFVRELFGEDGKSEAMEKVVNGMRLWNMGFVANCEEIIRDRKEVVMGNGGKGKGKGRGTIVGYYD